MLQFSLFCDLHVVDMKEMVYFLNNSSGILGSS